MNVYIINVITEAVAKLFECQEMTSENQEGVRRS